MPDNILSQISLNRTLLSFWFLLPICFAASLSASLLCRKMAIKFDIVDKPDGLVKTHEDPVAYLGGIGIFIGFFIGVFIAILILHRESTPDVSIKWLLGILAGAAVSCLVGTVDDIIDIKPWQKILGLVISAVTITAVGITPNLTFITDPLAINLSESISTIIGFIFTLIFVLGATNSLNLLDGLDGLCAGVTGVIGIGMLALGIILHFQVNSAISVAVIIMTLTMIGSVYGFLLLNKNPAKIFMGDAGSLFLGFLLAALMMLFASIDLKWCLSAIMIFGLPILDSAVAIVRRWINKRPIFVSDRGHIYDQMMDRGLSLRQTVWTCYLLAGVYAVVGIGISFLNMQYALLSCIAITIITGLTIWRKGFLKMEGLRGAVRNKEDR